jgi:DNA-binding NtrC family response regulator
MFIDAGYRVSLAAEADRARQILDLDVPDVCLIDARLWGEQGISLAEYAESLGVPVLMMTGDAGLSDEMDSRLRANIRKPFRFDTVVQRVTDIFNEGSVGRSIQTKTPKTAEASDRRGGPR